MLVSHDRSLLRSVCDEFWLVSRGNVEPFDGDLDDYQRYLLDEARRVREELKAFLKGAKEIVTQAPSPVQANRKIPANLKALKRDQGKLEQSMLDRQTRKHSLEARLSTPLPTQDFSELSRELKKIDDELAACEAKWLAISEQIEAEET
jgi:ATP-binding cassette subfamily F protein 3